MPGVADLLTFAPLANTDATAIRVTIQPVPGARAELARRLGLEIVMRLTEPSTTAFAAWLRPLGGGAPMAAEEKEEVLAYVGADFLDATDETRLQGAVVEHLWASVAARLNGGWGPPVHVEHDHFSVIDHGPDGVTAYEIGLPDLAFRLWESKRHAANGTVTATVSRAARQLRDHAPQYLARISKVLQTNPDARIAQLGGQIVTSWANKRPTASVGVTVGRSAGGAVPARPFVGLRRHFNYPEIERREGVLLEVQDLPGFALLVRDVVLAGT